jgi:putative transposase
MYSPTKIVKIIKSLIAREIFRRIPSVKETSWGGEFWTDGYYISTVGKKGDETVIQQNSTICSKVRTSKRIYPTSSRTTPIIWRF